VALDQPRLVVGPFELPQGLDQHAPGFVMNPVGTDARARKVDGAFVVMKGSTARKQCIAKWTNYKALRDQFVQDGRLVGADDPSLLVFAEDVAFASPSAAATVVFGGNQSGPQAWRTEDGAMTYKEWREAKHKQAGVKIPGS
jgi:hypothetical protein